MGLYRRQSPAAREKARLGPSIESWTLEKPNRDVPTYSTLPDPCDTTVHTVRQVPDAERVGSLVRAAGGLGLGEGTSDPK